MTYSFKYLTPALIALSVFAFSPAQAGADKNGGDVGATPTAPGNGDHDKNGGGGGDDKNGSGDHDKNGAGDHEKNGEPPAPPSPPPQGGHDKNGEPPAPPAPPSSPAPSPRMPSFSGGGNSSDIGTANITCVINGQVFRVRSVSECYVHPQYGSYQPRVPAYQPRAKKNRRAAVAGGYVYGGAYSGGYAGGYVYAPQPAVRYYQPASRAAVMQAQKRARKAAQGYGYAVQGGYGYAPQGYGYGGYAVQGGYGYDNGQVYAAPRKKMRRARSNAPVYMPNNSYDPGYVIHYGPTISKDGGY
jgi:hypothetical protein